LDDHHYRLPVFEAALARVAAAAATNSLAEEALPKLLVSGALVRDAAQFLVLRVVGELPMVTRRDVGQPSRRRGAEDDPPVLVPRQVGDHGAARGLVGADDVVAHVAEAALEGRGRRVVGRQLLVTARP
jgi:hypothetical protein